MYLQEEEEYTHPMFPSREETTSLLDECLGLREIAEASCKCYCISATDVK